MNINALTNTSNLTRTATNTSAQSNLAKDNTNSDVSDTKASSTTNNTGNSSLGAATKAANGVPNADYDTFIKLLVAQMKNQDPTKPMDSTEFVSQLASFSAVEQAMQTNTKLENTNAKLDDILINGPISQAEGYVGKYIKFDDGKGNVVEGTVQSVTIYSDGLTAKLDNGKDIIIGPGITVSNNKPAA